jgi:hypothetical protein
MSDAEFRALFTRFDPSVEPEFVERLLAEIDDVMAGPVQADAAGAEGEPAYLSEPPGHRMVTLATPRAPRRRAIAALAAVAAVIVVAVAVAVTRPSAHRQPEPVTPAQVPRPVSQPQLYWLDGVGIGRANLDGTGEVDLTADGQAGATCGIAVDRNYVYWSDLSDGTVARAKRDGTGVDTRFIVVSGNGQRNATGSTAPPPNAPVCLAVDGAHVYWTTSVSIGRANLDGTGVQQSFIPGVKAGPNPDLPACGIAVDRTHIYWANNATGTIGRANVDGTGAKQDFLVTGLRGSGSTGGSGSATPGLGCGVVVDGAHIYWGTTFMSPSDPNAPVLDGTIGRANLDGTGVNNSFISQPGVPLPVPCAEDGVSLYWATGGTARNAIGRASLDGTEVQQTFLTSGPGPQEGPGCAIWPSTHPQPKPPAAPSPPPPPSAQPQLYWRDAIGIGRANLDGTGIVHQLIPLNVGVNQGSGIENGGCGLAADHNYLYWPTGDTVARAKLDGTSVDTGFLVTGPGTNCIAVGGGQIYWATTASATSGGTIGRANLDGTAVQRAFIPDAKAPCGLALDSAHIYWANSAVAAQPGGSDGPSTGAIGRANLDGTGVNQDFISVPPSSSPPCGVVVDGGTIYWGAGPVTAGCAACFSIGSANVAGPFGGDTYATGPGPFGSFNLPCADDSRYLYWTYSFNGAAPGNQPPSPWAAGSPPSAWIGRSTLGSPGNQVQGDFITTGPDATVDTISGCAIAP